MSTPSRLGRYAVRRRIGSGGFATVWLAYDEQLDAPVAIKVLADNWSDQHEVRTRFIEEGRYLRRVESPHVVPVYDAGELEDGRPYLVMAYADQGTLADRLEVAGLTVVQTLEVVTQVGAGLQALHDRGILHRDVKPANVLFRTVDPASGSNTDGIRVMVGDLGLGKALDMSSRLTMIAGTPAFVAPEQAQGETPDARADQYSLAVLTFQLLSGRLPWNHATLPAAADPAAPAALSSPDREFPAGVEEVIRRALSRDRQWRWPTVTAFVEALTFELGAWASTRSGDTGGTKMLPIDPALTQPGARPSPLPAGPWMEPTSVPVLSKPRRRVGRAVAVGIALMVALGGGTAGGYFGERASNNDLAPTGVHVVDETGTLSVIVPSEWDTESLGEWSPPNAEGALFPALSTGTSASWTTDGSHGQGVFIALMPGTKLPDRVPQHAECSAVLDPVLDPFEDLGPTVTVVSTGCDGEGVTVERIVQVSAGQLLWVQARTDSRARANTMLDTIDVIGL